MSGSTGYIARRWRDLGSVFENRSFRLFSIGNFMSLTGIWIVRVCIGWTTWELMQSKTWLGIMAFAELGPSVLISIYSGPLADRMDRFAILRMGQSLQTLLALAMVALVLIGGLNVWWMLIVMLGYSIIGGLTLPARLAIAPTLVPPPQLPTASAIGSITLNITRFLGPLVAAPLLVASLDWMAFLIAALGFATNAACLSSVDVKDRFTGPKAESAARAPTGYGEVIRQIGTDRAMSLVLLFQFVLWLLAQPLTGMFPAFADLNFGLKEGGFAALNIAVGAGAVFGALAVMGQTAGQGMRFHVLAGSAVVCLAMMLFAAVSHFAVALTILFFYGAALTTTSVATTTFVQVRTPKSRLGRVMSIYSIVFRLCPAVGALLMGMAADSLGLSRTAMLFAAICLGVLLLMWRPFLRSLASAKEAV